MRALALAWVISGIGSWYGPGFEGRLTASGTIFNTSDHSCAMLDAPLGARVSIINPSNQRRSWCIVTDRGPYVGGRIIDVTPKVSRELGFYAKGIAKLILRIFVGNKKKSPDEMPTF